MSTRDNAPESRGLTPDEVQVFEAARSAVANLKRTFDLWVTIARAVELARRKADYLGGRDTFRRILEQQGLAPALGRSWDSQKATANKLLTILANLPQVEAWRQTLSLTEQIAWSAPTTIFKHCPIFRAGDEPPEERGPTTRRVSLQGQLDQAYTEGLADALAKAEAENSELKERIAALEHAMGDQPSPHSMTELESELAGELARYHALLVEACALVRELLATGDGRALLDRVAPRLLADVTATAEGA